MSKPGPVDRVKLLTAILWSGADALEEALTEMRHQWGEIDFSGPDRHFDATRYYESEMGSGLVRRLVSFSRLIPPEGIRYAKLACNDIEDRLACAQGRRVNLDIGYLDHNKLVLASAKYAGQKIHLGDGIYADLVARYKGGKYLPFEWTFPDFRDGRYDPELEQIRRIYLNQLRAHSRTDPRAAAG